MIKLKSIFAVSVLAMLVVVDAHADIASKGYVDEQLSNVTIDVDAALSSSSTNPVQNKVINSALAAKQNANTAVTHTANTAVGDSSHPVYVNASGAAVKIDKVAAASTADSATMATQDGSGRNIASTYVVKAQGSTAASKAVVTDSSGNITTGTIASGMIASGAVTSAKLGDDAVTTTKIASGAVGADALASGAVTTTKIADGTIVDADINANAAISASKIAGLADVATSGSYDDLTDAPTIPTVNNATLTIQKNGTNVATFTANSATAATANITVPTKTSELTNDSDFATTAQVNARVATDQGTANANDVMVVNASGNVVPALITNANVSSSAAIAQSKIAGLTDALNGKLSTTGTAAKATADASGNNIVNTYATKAQITALDSSTTGTGAVVTDVSQTDGKVSVTMGNVQIPVGSESATTYAKIWVE